MAIIQSSRRGFLTGLVSVLAAPAIVRVASIMPVSTPASGIGGVHALIYGGGRGGGKSNLLMIRQITFEAIRMFQNSNAFLTQIDQEYREALEISSGQQWPAPIGTRLRIRLPNDYVIVSEAPPRA